MTISPTSRTSHPLGVRPVGSPVGTKISNPDILIMGDSNLVSSAFSLDPNENSWAQPVRTMCAASGLTVNFVGNLSSGTPSVSHRGVAGSKVADHRAGGTYNSVTYVASLTPDIVIVTLGTNEAANDADRDAYGANISGLFQDIIAVAPSCNRMIISMMYPLADPVSQARNVVMHGQIAAAKAAIEALGGLVVVADLRVLTVQGHLRQSEGTSAKHIQNADGYALVADAMFPAIVNACGYNAVWVGDAVS
jgi:lysophospholipase L1-like esterase